MPAGRRAPGGPALHSQLTYTSIGAVRDAPAATETSWRRRKNDSAPRRLPVRRRAAGARRARGARRFDLRRFDPAAKPFSSGDKATDKAAVEALARELDMLQDLFYADRRFKLLVVLQGTDTARQGRHDPRRVRPD